jgi:hypothetical protein
MIEYAAESQWAGWSGGYGSESYIAERMNARSAQGWRLVRTEAHRSMWMWWFPRIKLLTIWEREKPADAVQRQATAIAEHV